MWENSGSGPVLTITYCLLVFPMHLQFYFMFPEPVDF